MRLTWPTAPASDQRLLIGISGGRDSVALLHLLLEAGFKDLVLCHCNHLLRADESDGDETFVRKLAADLSLPCEVTRVDVASLAEHSSRSIELAAREARYGFFEKCAETFESPHLVLGHHMDDQAETALFNLLRGSSSIQGMKPLRQRGGLTIHRPLLSSRREELTRYLSARNIPFREDSSNAGLSHTRNRIRHQALPLLQEIMQRDCIPPLARAAADQQQRLATLDHFLDPQGRLFLPALTSLPPAFQTQVLYLFLRQAEVPDISARLLAATLSLLDPAAPAKVNLPGGRHLRRKEKRIFIPDETSEKHVDLK